MSKGFSQIPNWVIFHPDLGNVDRIVYLVLAGHMDHKTRTCYPSHKAIMGWARIGDRRTVRNALKRLELVGAVEIIERKGYAHLYHLPKDPPQQG